MHILLFLGGHVGFVWLVLCVFCLFGWLVCCGFVVVCF